MAASNAFNSRSEDAQGMDIFQAFEEDILRSRMSPDDYATGCHQPRGGSAAIPRALQLLLLLSPPRLIGSVYAHSVLDPHHGLLCHCPHAIDACLVMLSTECSAEKAYRKAEDSFPFFADAGGMQQADVVLDGAA